LVRAAWTPPTSIPTNEQVGNAVSLPWHGRTIQAYLTVICLEWSTA
jgi:hypothetical protein